MPIGLFLRPGDHRKAMGIDQHHPFHAILNLLLEVVRILPHLHRHFIVWTQVKKSLESDYPRPKAGAFRPIHGDATAISFD
jgi:hypothetical protein